MIITPGHVFADQALTAEIELVRPEMAGR